MESNKSESESIQSKISVDSLASSPMDSVFVPQSDSLKKDELKQSSLNDSHDCLSNIENVKESTDNVNSIDKCSVTSSENSSISPLSTGPYDASEQKTSSNQAENVDDVTPVLPSSLTDDSSIISSKMSVCEQQQFTSINSMVEHFELLKSDIDNPLANLENAPSIIPDKDTKTAIIKEDNQLNDNSTPADSNNQKTICSLDEASIKININEPNPIVPDKHVKKSSQPINEDVVSY